MYCLGVRSVKHSDAGQRLLIVIAAALVLAIAGCDQSSARKTTAQTQPATTASATRPMASLPASSGDAPLLLDDGPAAKIEGQADNSRCEVCHLNLVAEELAVQHAKANISCAKCHGESDAHIADESWGSGGNGTAPDKMFVPEKINPMCLECHPRAKLSHDNHKSILDGAADAERCTSCHGKHKLVNRKCKWK